MLFPRRVLHRCFRAWGMSIQRRQDPYAVAQALLGGRRVDHAIDGGAYHGSIPRRLASLFPEATIHAFEPQTSTFGVLTNNLRGTSRVKCYKAAISNTSGLAVLHVNEKAFTTSLLATLEPVEMISVEAQNTTILTLDEWAAEQSIQSVPFIKLDLQGHELAALQGAERLLEDGVDIIL